MTIEPFRTGDIARFLNLAKAENWLADPWEFEFLLANFPRGCFAARVDNGEGAGFVTSLRHGQSGWIGNLIVSGLNRGQGIGERLFARALEALRDSGVETVWLTASKAGQALYERHGFSSVDTIMRWTGAGLGRAAPHGSRNAEDIFNSPVGIFDSRAWGDRRDALLAATVKRGRLLLEDSGFAVIQPCAGADQLGPFTAMDGRAAERILETALVSVTAGSKIYLDAPASNRDALDLFNRKRLELSGTTNLMYAGKRPDYRPDLIFGLATMGSCG